ncbi:zinc-dependent metalloprotease [Bacteroides sp. OttesenSCG-928-J23]|nr:zinc-dependent metalloprotease [Bacteroides sp. OttesenSCG-928-N06]MDL2247549.1 zinc-dependent metalloprotease [Bacteroides sp. OttesenSCG-928-J23]MDL2299088.1 zinc-dependent metalloprotease [Bacteroides sp. OttesenSCG-928-E20]MDL2304141.1 zinc-dependent metalloprotease [Bacteroides sp. OttesenSCG-928-D19]
MKTTKFYLGFIAAFVFLFTACSNEEVECSQEYNQSNDIDYISIIKSMGFSLENLIEEEEQFIVEKDIVLIKEDLLFYANEPITRQAQHKNLVSKPNQNDIKVKIHSSTPYSWYNGINQAIAAWNNIGSSIKMKLVTTSSYDIEIKAQNKGENNRVAATGTYPSGNGKPGSTININSYYDYLSTGQKAYIIVHELGHNIGFAHSDVLNTGESNIPGTPLASPTNPDIIASVMYSKSGGRNWDTEQFTMYDKYAAWTLYNDSRVEGPTYLPPNSNAHYTLTNLPPNSHVLWESPISQSSYYPYSISNRELVDKEIRYVSATITLPNGNVVSAKSLLFIYLCGVTSGAEIKANCVDFWVENCDPLATDFQWEVSQGYVEDAPVGPGARLDLEMRPGDVVTVTCRYKDRGGSWIVVEREFNEFNVCPN